MLGRGERGHDTLVGLPLRISVLPAFLDLLKARAGTYRVFRGGCAGAFRGNKFNRLGFERGVAPETRVRAAGKTSAFFSVGPLKEEVQQQIAPDDAKCQK